MEIEPDLVYPLLRLGDLKRWKARPTSSILMVQDPATRRGIDQETLQREQPRTFAYLKSFEPLLRERAAFKRYFMRPRSLGKPQETGPFYSMFNVGPYTVAPWKVVWGRFASDVYAAVIGRRVIPQETITLVPTESESEAHYICAVLNSSPFRFAAIAYSQAGGKSFGSPHLLQNLRIPLFDPADGSNAQLAALSKEAHTLGGEGTSAIEAAVDDVAAALWGIDTEELASIQDGFREMMNLSIEPAN